LNFRGRVSSVAGIDTQYGLHIQTSSNFVVGGVLWDIGPIYEHTIEPLLTYFLPTPGAKFPDFADEISVLVSYLPYLPFPKASPESGFYAIKTSMYSGGVPQVRKSAKSIYSSFFLLLVERNLLSQTIKCGRIFAAPLLVVWKNAQVCWILDRVLVPCCAFQPTG